MYSQQSLCGKLARFSGWLLAFAGILVFSLPLLAQTTVGTGSIVGTVTDPSGAVLRDAKVAITNVATGQVINTATNSSGAYNSGALVPGSYKVQISAKGFSSVSVPVTVQVGNTSTANAKLQIGQESQVVEVQASEVQVNTEQPTVQGVLNAQQIENLPVNGRNFLDLAQLEPGVQIQDGQNFDPTKAGYSSISFGGRFGRTARIEVDGVDVSDETVGTTTTDIPASAIQEFQISQSSLDMSSELTSSGAVNVTTRSGTNAYHGEAFGGFRDSSMAAKLPAPPGFAAPFQRSQYGGRFGGPIMKDKMFFFMDGERTVQHSQVPVPISAPFQQYSGTFSDAFREGNLLGKLDYQLTKNAHAFYRFTYYKSILGANFGYGYSLYDTKNITRDHVVGVDFNTGTWTHAVRFSYLKFQNQIQDAVIGSSLPFNNLGLEIIMGNTGLIAGPNLLAPQMTPQSNRQVRYDGSKPLGSHIIRFGISYNHIQGGGFASFFKNAPLVVAAADSGEVAAAATGPFPGGSANPLNYPADSITMGNGLGFATTKPSFQFPGGGLGPDNRILTYLGDSWKIKPNFTLTYGLRYERDTGRTDSDLPAIPALNQLFPGLGNPVRQPNTNFAPQMGFAWDPTGAGKTSIRGGIGLFYENAIWNNVLFDAPPREATGAFLIFTSPCAAPGSPAGLPVPGGQLKAGPSVCGTSSGPPLIGNSAAAIAAFQQQWQAATPVDLKAANPNYLQTDLTQCPQGIGCFFPTGVSGVFAPNYRSPRSVQMNIGIQREIRPGMVISADFIRNVQTHFLLSVDVNHAGDIHYFNKTGAIDAINATLANCGVASIQAGISAPCPGGANPATAITGRTLTIADFAGNGLGSSTDMGGSSCLVALGYPCAFGGINPAAPPMGFLQPIGRSVYNGLQLKWTDNVKQPFRGVRGLNFQVSYALSRFDNSGGAPGTDRAVTAGTSDQDFIIGSLDNSQPNRYFGPSVLDRTHQLSFGGYADLPGGFQFSLISHFYSPLSTTLIVPNTAIGAGEIFRTDFTGDGTVQDPLPGTHEGSFDRSVNASNLNNLINAFNGTINQVTPAGQTLISSGLFTLAQMQALGATINGGGKLATAPPGQVNLDWLRAFDMTLSWNYNIKEKLTIRPSVGFYNLFNFANFDLPGSALSGALNGGTGSVNGTDYAGHFTNRAGAGTGLNSLGTPRQIEFGLRVTF